MCGLCFKCNKITFFSLQEWFTVYEHNRRTNCTASDLIMGNEYMFRVYSENLCGLSEEPRHSKNTAVIAKTGVTVCACAVQYVCVCVSVCSVNCVLHKHRTSHFC